MDDICKKQKNDSSSHRFETENKNSINSFIRNDFHGFKRSWSEGDGVNHRDGNSDNLTIMMQRSDNNYAQLTLREGANVNVKTATIKLHPESSTTTEPGASVNRNVNKTNMLEMHFENLLHTLPL